MKKFGGWVKNFSIVILIITFLSFISRKEHIVSTEKIRVTQTSDLASVPETTADLLLVIDVGVTIATGTLVFPANPIDGQTIAVSTRSQVTAVTLNAGSIPISGAITTLAAGGTVAWVYDQASNRWFRYP
jgi:hypothetical protein